MDSQKEKVIFETFNDGICSIREINEEGDAGREIATLRFDDRTIGAMRHYEAMTNKVRLDRLIRVPFQPWITSEYLAVIEGKVYEIVQAQFIPDSLPKTNDLSLSITRQRRIADGIV